MHKRIVAVLLIVALALALVPFAGAQEGPLPTKVEFVPYEDNPILRKGDAGEWDSGFVFGGAVIYHDGLFHMFYSGADSFYGASTTTASVGYATSEDGFHWTKYAQNPVLIPDESVALTGIGFACPVIDGDTWVLFLAPRVIPGARDTIMMATAPAPTGPWTVQSEPVLEGGDSLDWDGDGTALMTALRTDSEYVLGYWTPSGYGRATSPDGITWTKYNDPATMETPFANSDPIFEKGAAEAWDSSEILPIMTFGEHGWEMFYITSAAGSNYFRAMGYAASPDGVHWTRLGEGPVLEYGEEYVNTVPDSVVVVDGTYYLYHSIWYGDKNPLDVGISVTTGTVTWH